MCLPSCTLRTLLPSAFLQAAQTSWSCLLPSTCMYTHVTFSASFLLVFFPFLFLPRSCSLFHIFVLFPLLSLQLHYFFPCQQHRSDCADPTWKITQRDCTSQRSSVSYFSNLKKSWHFLTYYLPPPCALRTFLHSPPGTCWKQRWKLLLCPQTCRWRARFRSGWRECFRKKKCTYIEWCLRVKLGLCRGMNHNEYCVCVMCHVCTLYVWSQHAKNYINAFGKSRCTSWSRNCMGL